ncbi:MAG: serine hydrolase [Caldilineaceae bacterium]|nr:serine hydrolase [Caldilineaceae bacterium]
MQRFITFLLLFIGIAALFPLYSRYKVSAAPIPPGVYLGGLALSTVKEPAEIRRHLESIYYEPVGLYFQNKRLPLQADEVDFYVDAEQMIQEATRYLEGTPFIDIAVREALGFSQQRRDVPVRFTLNSEKLRAWLTDVATSYNYEPSPPRALAPRQQWNDGTMSADSALPAGYVGSFEQDWSWQPGEPGYTLDVEASIPQVIAAFTAQEERTATLILTEKAPPAPAMAELTRALDAYTADFPGFAALYIQDLTSGEEAKVDADVAFSGMSTLKIAIVIAVMQKLDGGIQADHPVSRDVGVWIDYALGDSNNYAANQLLRWLGDGNMGAGAQRVTELMRTLGFVNTYMQSGYDVDVRLPQIPTPGNQREDWNTNPDPNLQSTPTEMGQLLAAVYHCMQGEGILIERYADTITPDECETILFYMSHDEFQEMLWGGLPNVKDAWILHKHGFAYESHSDVALIWGPTGPYVISFFVYRPGWMDWATSNSRMKGVSRATWRFFEFQQEKLGVETPTAPLITPPPGYAPFKEYIPVTSTGGR